MLQAGCLFFTLKSTDSRGILNDKIKSYILIPGSLRVSASQKLISQLTASCFLCSTKSCVQRVKKP